jgi:hypothetical protein
VSLGTGSEILGQGRRRQGQRADGSKQNFYAYSREECATFVADYQGEQW